MECIRKHFAAYTSIMLHENQSKGFQFLKELIRPRNKIELNSLLQEGTNLSSDGMELSEVPWNRMIRGSRRTAPLALGSPMIFSGENFSNDFSPSMIL